MNAADLGLWAAMVWLTQTGAAGAAAADTRPAPLLALGLGRCPAVPPAEVQGLVGVELRRPVALFDEAAARPAAEGATERPGITAVRVTCVGLRAEIEVDDPLTGKTVGRAVDLAAAAPVARPHLLALSIVELLAASWIELQSNPRPASPPAGAVPTTVEAREAALDVVRSRPAAARAARVVAAAGAQASSAGPRTWSGGLVVAGDVRPDRRVHLGWLVDLNFQYGDRTFALGRVTAETVSSSGALLAGVSGGRAALRVGLGVRGGGAWLSGAPADPGTAVGGAVRGAWWGPLALVDGTLTVWRRVVIELTVEAGRVVLPVVATVQGSEPVAVDGSWIRGTLGVGFTL